MRRLVSYVAVCLASAGVSAAQAPVQAGAQAARIAFAPPLDRPLAYRITQHAKAGKARHRYDSMRELRFAREGSGYRLRVILRTVDSDAPPDRQRRYKAAFAPLVDVPQTLHVDAHGRITAIDDLDRLWTAFMRGQEASLAAPDSDPAHRRDVRTAVAALKAMDAPARFAVLAGDLQPLMLFASGHLLPNMVQDVSDTPAHAIYHEDDAGNGVRVRYRVARATGLVERAEKHVDRPPRIIDEIRLLEPMSR